MRSKYIIFGLIIFVVLFFFIENMEQTRSTSQLSNKEIQNIEKVYPDTVQYQT